MKPIIPLFFILLTLSNCKKEDTVTHHVYTVHIGIPVSFISPPGSTNRLVVTESGTGKFLGEFELPKNAHEFTGQLNIEGELPEAFDYHLIQPTVLDHPYYVDSYIGVKNESYVYFSPLLTDRWLSKEISLKISGIQAFDSIATGFFRPKNVVFDQNEQTLSMDIPTFYRQGIILRLHANGASGFRYYYLPENLQGDTLNLNWNDLSSETNIRQVSQQGNPYIYSFEIDAVSPDYKNAISVCRSEHMTTTPTFNLPEILPSNWLLRVKVYGSEYFCERLFGLNEPLAISQPNISIDNLEYSNNQIIVNTSGEVDVVRCSSFEGDFYWEINGSKAAFAKVALPDLSPYLPASVKQSSIKTFFAYVKQFEGHNPQEIQEGFPYRNTGFFPVARSGFYQIQKSF